MLRPFLFLIAVATAAPGCQLAASLGLGDKSDSPASSIAPSADEADAPASVADIPDVEADEDDPVAVSNLIRELDNLEASIHSDNSRALVRYATVSREIGRKLFYPDNEDIADSPKLDKLRARFVGIQKALARMGGGHAPEIVGDAIPPKDDPPEDALEIAQTAAEACQDAAATTLTGVEHTREKLATAYAAYEKQLARAKKVDPAALQYLSPEFAVCEFGVASLRAYLDDSYVPEEPKQGTDTACGKKTFLVRAVRLSGNRFGSYEYAYGSTSYPEKVSCKKVKRKSKVPGKYRAAVNTFLDREDVKGKGAVVVSGKPFTEVDKSDLHVYKYVELSYTSKKMLFASNPCGGKKANLACEASGSKTAGALNQIEFALERADVHRDAGRADRCKDFLKSAYKMSQDWQSFAAEEKKYGRWKKGLRYKSKKGEVYDDAEIAERITELGSTADERVLGTYCDGSAAKVSAADAE